MKQLHLLSFLLLVLISCQKETSSEFTDTPIVEAYLTPGSLFSVHIYRQTPFSSNVSYSSDDINNLLVTVTYDGGAVDLSPQGNGVYTTTAINIEEGQTYTVSFEFNSKLVVAYTYIPSKPLNFTQSSTEIEIERMDTASGPPSFSQPDPIELYWDNPDKSYYLVVVENIATVLDPIRDFGDEEPPENIFRKNPTQAIAEELSSMDFQYYGLHRIILYHVLPDYASLYSESTVSSQNITNPSTSISNAYGIFTGLNADTLYVNVKEP